MTERLYYTEPHRVRFSARVVETLRWDERPAVVLDRTAFYPESGGQPADRGKLDGAAVIDVVERPADGAIVHVLSEQVPGGCLEGEVDWQRRFDHMQQHSGQHILSAVFERQLGAQTVGFHLGTESSTIDLDVTALNKEDVHRIEARANEVVWQDRPVSVRFVDGDAVAQWNTERPADVAGPLRLLVIADSTGGEEHPLDANPCGGTHVTRTGEIGLIKIVDLERRGEQTRVSFLCGRRALLDYDEKHGVLTDLAGKLTVGYWELEEAVQRLQEENRVLRHSERALRDRLLDLESEQLADSAAVRGEYRVIGHVWRDRSPNELRILARKLAERPRTVALLFSVAERTHFCFARADDLDTDVNALLQEACTRLDGKGGGRPQAAQGSAPADDVSEIEGVLQDLLAGLGPP